MGTRDRGSIRMRREFTSKYPVGRVYKSDSLGYKCLVVGYCRHSQLHGVLRWGPEDPSVTHHGATVVATGNPEQGYRLSIVRYHDSQDPEPRKDPGSDYDPAIHGELMSAKEFINAPSLEEFHPSPNRDMSRSYTQSHFRHSYEELRNLMKW